MWLAQLAIPTSSFCYLTPFTLPIGKASIVISNDSNKITHLGCDTA